MSRKPFLNLVTSWSSVGIFIIIAFFLTPFIIHKLGDTRYGIWSLVSSLVGYMGLADLGLRRSISKHINQYLAQKNTKKALQVISTSIALLLIVGFIIVMIGGIAGLFSDKIIGNNLHYKSEVRIAVLLMSIELAIGLQGSIFKRIIESFDRFDLLNYLIITNAIFRSIGIFTILNIAPTLIGLATISLIAQILLFLSIVFVSFKVWPQLSISPSQINKKIAIELRKFGIPTFFDNISIRIIDYSDILIIGLFLSAKQITIYSISLMLINYSKEFIGKIVTIMAPTFFKKTSLDDKQNISSLFMQTTNNTAFLCIPLATGFFFFGHDFINLWMGNKYGEASKILSILSFIFFIIPLREPAKLIIMGLNQPRRVASVSYAEVIMNLSISIILVKSTDLGLTGIAIGTIIPATIASFYLNIIATKMIQHKHLIVTLVKWVETTACFSLLCLIGQKFIICDTWIIFGLVVSFLIISYIPIGFFLILSKETRSSIVSNVKALII